MHWNAPRPLKKTIARFREQGLDTHIVVVDNESEPSSLDGIDELADEVLPGGGNLGYGPGANVGLRHWLENSATEWCVVAPHDALPDPGALAVILGTAADHPKAGLLCGDVGDQASPIVDPYLGPLPGPSSVFDGYEAVTYPHGTMMILRRSCVEDIGMFDERYFSYNEEADLGLRANDAGWEVGLVRNVMVENPGQGSGSAVVDYLMLRNTILLVREHFGLRHALFRTAVALGQLALSLIPGRPRSPWFSAKARRLALRDAWTKNFGPPPASL